MPNVAHRARALPLQYGAVYVAICSCGWVGPDHKGPEHKDKAIQDANQHTVDWLRKNQPLSSDPRQEKLKV